MRVQDETQMSGEAPSARLSQARLCDGHTVRNGGFWLAPPRRSLAEKALPCGALAPAH